MIILPTSRGMPLKPALIKDPYFSNVKLLMHCDGNAGGTTFIDSSTSNRSISILSGSVTTDQSRSKFGNASINLNAGSLTFNKTGINFTTGDWTVECWINFTNASSAWATASQTITYSTNSDLDITISNGGLAFIGGNNIGTYVSNFWTANTWNHIAFVKSGTTMYYFINGILNGSTITYYLNNANSTLNIGDTRASTPSKYYIDEFRITYGTARYISNFSVPTLAFPNS